jgi:hypothetical protein
LIESTISARSSALKFLRGWSGLGTMALRETWRITSPFSAEGSGSASCFGLPISALSPLPRAAVFAIPDFGKSARGGKLIRCGVRCWEALRNYQISKLTEWGRSHRELKRDRRG